MQNKKMCTYGAAYIHAYNHISEKKEKAVTLENFGSILFRGSAAVMRKISKNWIREIFLLLITTTKQT